MRWRFAFCTIFLITVCATEEDLKQPTRDLKQSVENQNLPELSDKIGEVTVGPVPSAPVVSTTSTTVEQSNHTTTISVQPNDENTCAVFDEKDDKLTQDQFSTKLTRPCRYDKLAKPDTVGPLKVWVQLDIRHIEADQQLKFKMHMMIKYRYVDERLAFADLSPNRETMVGEELLKNKIWFPHIQFYNERDSAIMGLGGFGKDMFVSISPHGEVTFSLRITTTIYCWMDLRKFPFDEQTCSVNLKSWTYNNSNLILHWENKDPVSVAHQLHLTEFALEDYSAHETHQAGPLSSGAFSGNYSVLVFKFLLSRQVGYYLMDYFIPSIMLVITSWVTFWLQADNTAPRVTLGTSTMLSFITLASGQSKNLPKVSYIKASEIWFLGCIFFIFASICEFAFVNIIWRRKKKVELKKVNSKYILKSTLTPRLARKELERSHSMNNLHKSHSCSSLDGVSNKNNDLDGKGRNNTYNNYLTVHGFTSELSVPTITTQSADDLLPNQSKESMTTSINLSCKSEEEKVDKNQHQSITTMTPQEIACWIDKRSRIVFPIAFLIFNTLYWSFVYAL